MMTWKCGFKFKLFDWSSVLEGGSLRRADLKPFLRDPLPIFPHSFHSFSPWYEFFHVSEHNWEWFAILKLKALPYCLQKLGSSLV